MTEPLLRLSRVARTYRNGDVLVEALKPVDLEVAAGTCVAVTGPSGSGKSTLLHVLGCLDRATSGTYLLDGRDVTTLADRELAAVRNRLIGFVFQRFHLLRDETAQRNVELPLLYAGVRRAERRRRAEAALDAVGLAARAAHVPGRLSGGEQQRVAIARALVKEPRLLLADEPTGNLDTASGEAVLAMLDALHARGVTVVLITHDPEVAAHGSRQLTIRNGVVAEVHPSAAGA
ncbi:MAG: ABC transporter ATP-binding protein [Planctomycetota bacterium]